jgi:hypothetical protein
MTIFLNLCPEQSSKCTTEQKAYALPYYSLGCICIQSLRLIPFIVLMFCSGQSSNSRNKQRAITRELRVTVLMHCNSIQWDL